MPVDCVSCKKKVSDDDDEAYCVFKCRKDHVFKLCTVECLRMFEKKCMKVSDNLVRVQHKLNNDGHTSALRRLPPSEREKLKQHAEAESLGLFICPEEVKASERSVPHCAHIMKQSGGYGKDAGPSPVSAAGGGVAAAAPPPPPAPRAGGSVSEPHSLELVDDDMLLEIKRDDNLDEMPGEASGTKGKKKKQNSRKGQTLLLDWKTTPIATDESPSSALKAQPATTTRNPGGIGIAQQAWSAVASRSPDTPSTAAPPSWASGPSSSPAASPGAGPGRKPENWQERVTMLVSAAGCSELKAVRLLELNDWIVNRAADAYFREEASDAAEGAPRRQTLAEKVKATEQKQAQPQQLAKAQPQQQQAEPKARSVPQPPAPTIPPPPPLPEGWQAVWNEEQQAYYYWNVPTNETSWDLPEMQDGDKQPESKSQQGPSQETLIARLQEATKLNEASARSLLQENSWDLDQALQSHSRAVEEEARKKAEEEEAKAVRKVAEAARRRAEEEAAAAARAEAAAAAAALRAQRCALGRSVCTRHWRPAMSGLDACIRLNEGEQVMVTWTDGETGGWAYGQLLDDPGRKEGYFPQAVVKEFLRPSRRIEKGELRQALEAYEAPADISGYLSLEAGDVLTVLHPVTDPFVWVYAERSCPGGGPSERGWVPEASLGDVIPKGLQAERGPHPAG